MAANRLFSLDGESALVTGGSTGIGAAISRLFLQMGARVTIASRRESKLQAFRDSVPQHALSLHSVPGDVAVDSERIVATAVAAMGSISILVNNASTSVGKPMSDMTGAEWQTVYTTNLEAAFRLCQSALPSLEANRGCILHISSASAVAGDYDDAAYVSSKSGLEGFSRHLAVELAADGVRSNVIRPGLINTEAFADYPDEFFESQIPLIPLGRLGSPEDVAYAALYLCSREAAFVTGAVLTVDGGETRI